MQTQDVRRTPEVEALFQQQAFEIYVRVDRAFAALMLIQWVAVVLVALWVTPHTWMAQSVGTYQMPLMAVFFGGLFALPPVYCVLALPGQRLTRHVVAIAQVCFSILLIHLTGGRIETHFHVFVSLAFLAFYQEVGILWAATFIVVGDHLIRGYMVPISVYGVAEGVEWRWVEHLGWVLIEVYVLMLGIGRIRHELYEMAVSKYQLLQAKEAAFQVAKLKSQFLSNMSHEIRTPLNSIIGFSDMLAESRMGAEQTRYVKTIQRCSESLLHLINDVLDFSKMENGLMRVDRHRFDVQELHEDIHSMFAVKCQEKGLSLEVVVEADLPRFAVGDSHRLRQILINLISNAIKFTEQGGVRVHLKKVGVGWRWEISDSGVGISKEVLPRLFQRFSQGDTTITRRFGGTGLGLVISKNLVELMGGDISVRSQEGHGSVFSFSLPIEEG